VRCKIFYQRDYVSLLVKYGLESPSAIGPDASVDAPAGLDLTSGDDGPPDDGAETPSPKPRSR
jgi:hypothetical protein